MTLEELKRLYAEKGATTQRITQSGNAGDVIDYLPNDFGDGWSASEDQPIIGYEGQGMDATPITGDKVLSGFTQKKDGMDYFYDPEGVFKGSRKSEEADTFWDTFGPLIMGAVTMGGGGAFLGNSLFGLTGTAAAGAGGALAGGVNAAMTDQDILKGALLGGASGAGAMKLGDTGLTLGNVTNAAKAIQNKDALGLLSSGSGLIDASGFDLNGMSASDIAKYAGLAKGLTSGGAGTINALASLSKDSNFNNLMSSLGDGQINPNDFTEGYFLPGGEGYIDPMSKTEGVTGSGYYDEITGRYIKDDLGGLTNPLGRETGNLDPNSKWEYSLTRPGVWVNDKGEEIDLSYLPNTEKVMTGREIMEKAGALSSGTKTTTGKSGTDTSTKTPTTSQQSGSGQQAQLPSEDPYADIKLMEQLFGGDIDYKLRSLGADTQKKPASNSMDALSKLLRG
jgi:hypothetical protein